MKKIKRELKTIKHLWDRDDYLDRIIAGNKMMWANQRIKDMISDGDTTSEEANKLMLDMPLGYRY